ncbi:MAG: hypothetical protein AAGE94_25645 [Acidobacteriota bacterium]
MGDHHPGDSGDALKEGIAAAIRDDASEARVHLWRAVNAAPREVLAWQWLAKVAENREELELARGRVDVLRGEIGESRRKPIGTLRSDHRERPPARGQCPLCDLPWADPPQRCPRCRALLDIADPTAFFAPLDVEVGLLRDAIERWSRRHEITDLMRHRALLLARLNLCELPEALAHGRVVADLAPSDEGIARLCRALSELLSAMPAETGFETDVIDRPTADELDAID